MENNEKEREITTTEEEDMDKNNNENRKYDESRIYYVYKHIRLDNNTCFYIGKGKDGRKDVPNRNPTHDSICDRHGYKVVIFKDKLNEKEAFKLEEDLIRCYVFKMGYGICIKGYMNNNNKFLTNRTFGGEGTSGLNAFENKTKEEMEEIGKKISESVSGEKNGMWGKPSPNRGKKGLFNWSEEAKKNFSESHSGENNGMWGKPAANRRKVMCVTTGKTFDSIKEASDHYKVAQCSISECCKGKRKHAGKLNGVLLQWKYEEDYDN